MTMATSKDLVATGCTNHTSSTIVFASNKMNNTMIKIIKYDIIRKKKKTV